MFEATFGTGLAKEVLGDVEAICRLGWSEQLMVPAFVERGFVTTDHRLTKIPLLPWCCLYRRRFCAGLRLGRFRRVATR